jgi:DNA-binding response OmpR family regulator/HPt (histidine-containing phosphotransfer) domain-containing protein
MPEKKRIFLCDDDPAMLEFMLAQLSSDRISCTTTMRGRDAVKKVLEESYDLVVLDACLPDLNGERVTQSIRDRLSSTECPILVVSAFFRRSRDQVDLLRGWNVQGFMSKPLLGPLFRKEVFRILGIEDGVARPEPKLSHLQARFLQDVDAVISKFREAFTALEVPASAVQILQNLRAQAHRIHGTAGTYGYSTIAKLADQIEESVDPCLPRSSQVTLAEWRKIERMVELLLLAAKKEESDSSKLKEPSEGAILYLGDDTVFLQSLEKEAAERLRTVIPARRESDVIQLARERMFNLLILDMDYKAPNPGDLIRTMKSLAGAHPIPVICAGRQDNTAARVLAGRCGADMYHKKGGPLTELFEAIEAVRDERKREAKLILAVDDDELQLTLLKSVLTDSDWRVKGIKIPEQALTAVRELEPALILLDLEMPGCKGYDLCRALKTDDKLRQIPVVMLSAHDDPAVRLRCLEAGALDFVLKGTPIPELKVRMKNLLLAIGKAPHPKESREIVTTQVAS